jgi:adenylylsulfate kinase
MSDDSKSCGETQHKPGFAVWLTGLPSAGKSTIGYELADALRLRGHRVEVLDGDVVRENLSRGLGFSREDRDINVRRIGFVAQLLSRNGVSVVVAAVSPYESTRREVRRQIERFVEVYVECPLNECERRDVKGLYKKARAQLVSHFTGIDDPYEPPPNPEVTLRTNERDVEASVNDVMNALEQLGYI